MGKSSSTSIEVDVCRGDLKEPCRVGLDGSWLVGLEACLECPSALRKCLLCAGL